MHFASHLSFHLFACITRIVVDLYFVLHHITKP
uniref:Uncharacterized protein n=1 Tax=Anguilla anguilla TaxID=7936 RepID=A0A0E9R4R3_ANGAN